MRLVSIKNEVTHNELSQFLQIQPLWYASAVNREIEHKLVYGEYEELIDMFGYLYEVLKNLVPPQLEEAFRLQIIPGSESEYLESYIARYHYYNIIFPGSLTLAVIRDRNKLAPERYVGNLFCTRIG